MYNQVLSIEQMQEIIELGIDTSKASAFYYPNYGEYYEHPITKKYVHNIKSYNPYPSFVNGDRTLKDLNPDLFPTFTLQDILETLPKHLNIKDKTYFLTLMYDITGIVVTYCTEHIKDILHSEWSSNQINAAFNMLKWCKENKYI